MTGSRPLDLLLGHFAGGGAFFTACGLLACALALRAAAWPRGDAASAGDAAGETAGEVTRVGLAADGAGRAGVLVGLTGATVLAFSAAPLPRAWYGFTFCAVLWWLFAARPDWAAGWRWGSTAAVGGLAAVGAVWELAWWRVPNLPRAAERAVVVVGDSLAAGIGRETVLWPAVLGERLGADVAVRAVPGAKVADPLTDPWWDLPDTGGVMLLELGGNDVLGRTNPGAFREDYRTLLERLRRRTADRVGAVVAVAIPLPPFRAAYGRAQRAACDQAGVPLIPRRVLASALFGPAATVDGLHLSPAGHRALAAALAPALAPALPPPDG